MGGVAVSSLLLCFALGVAQAQPLYKIIGPDGRVSYTDQPPARAAKVVPLEPPAAGHPSEVALPPVLREATARFPVTLYTAPDCEPCTQARSLLQQRGVPHQERTVAGDADRDAWSGIVGGPEAPALQVGAEIVRALSPSRWHALLDTAGYPRQSQLPPTYVQRPATPLVERKPVAPPPAAATPPAPAEPGAIRF